ncbi:HGGxSTG domain-containing protein [Mycobacterium sp. 852002-10029_SCH5224772]|uniref:HGGxSTG domain-containing protein n=1 Tax=Mycobacterium sp. 852002-10029_SCH5224772 TaxID=1834083 RepID=UPI0009ED9862|nr:HGGxSTG domain-containing protein [Mycobacterium sp. 852002-10029_SCH5224772]
MSDEDNIIDVEAEEIPDGGDNLPAVIPRRSTEENGTPRISGADETHEGAKSVKARQRDDGRDWPHGPLPERRCRAHSSRTGEPCKNAAIKGSTVCRFHGGAAKQVKANARARLENAAELMAKQLLGIALTAESEAVKLAAIKDALDRSGLKPPSEVVLSQGETKPYEELFDGIATGSRAESRRARGLPDTDERPAGFEVVEHDTLAPPATAAQAHSQSHPPREAEPDEADREGDAESGQRPPSQPRARHITGEDAVYAANRANREIGALKAIESPHRRYRRP